MNNNNYCLLDGMEEHFCRRCDSCYCKFIDEHGHEPTDEEIESEIERQMAEAEARANSFIGGVNMKDITNAIFDLHKKSICVDFLKSNFIMCSECLISRILTSDNSLDYDIEIKSYMNYLINSKDDLILNLKELINYIELLDLELQEE